MQGRQIDLLGGDELVLCVAAEVLDEVHEKRVVQGVLSEEDDVGALGREVTDDGLAYAARTTLYQFSVTSIGSW